jgi:membrane-bound ClpP family serine protease
MCSHHEAREAAVFFLIFGVILIVVGILVPKLSVLFTIGVVVAIIGVILLALALLGHPVAGRRW